MKKVLLVAYILLSSACLFAGNFDSIDSTNFVGFIKDGGNYAAQITPPEWIPHVPNNVVIGAVVSFFAWVSHKLINHSKKIKALMN